MKKGEILLAAAIVLLLAVIRFLPHPVNFTPIIAIGLFAGLIFKSNTLRWMVPIACMVVSDIYIGFHSTTLFVYGAIAAVVGIGLVAPKFSKNIVLSTGLAAFLGSAVFFIVTNFGVWAMQSMYTKDLSGLMQSYVMAIPFFHNTLISTLLFSFSAVLVYKTVSKKVFSNSAVSK